MCLPSSLVANANSCSAGNQWGIVHHTAYIPHGLGHTEPLTQSEVNAAQNSTPFFLSDSAISSEGLIHGSSSFTWREVYVAQGIMAYSLLTRGRRVIVRGAQCADIAYIIEHVYPLNENSANISVFAYFRQSDETAGISNTSSGLRCLDAVWTPFVLVIRNDTEDIMSAQLGTSSDSEALESNA